MKNYRYTVRNLDCANCAKKIEDKLSSYNEYKNVQLNFATLKLSLETDKENNVKEDIQKIISSIEPEVKIVEGDEQVNSDGVKKDVIRLIIRSHAIFYFNAYSYGNTISYSSYNFIIYCAFI